VFNYRNKTKKKQNGLRHLQSKEIMSSSYKNVKCSLCL